MQSKTFRKTRLDLAEAEPNSRYGGENSSDEDGRGSRFTPLDERHPKVLFFGDSAAVVD